MTANQPASTEIGEDQGLHDMRGESEANNAEIAYASANSSYLNRIEARFTASRSSPSTAPAMPTAASSDHPDGNLPLTWRYLVIYSGLLRMLAI
ncbi:hypothetical protein [Streptomyces anulatus]|uniref:hypothetical protein n=1 Tax=Streptomyces anulatus TaxID=1892 RepID=UPI0034178435